MFKKILLFLLALAPYALSATLIYVATTANNNVDRNGMIACGVLVGIAAMVVSLIVGWWICNEDK